MLKAVMRFRGLSAFRFALFVGVAALAPTSFAAEPNVHAGRARAYEHLQEESLEDITSAEAIRNIRVNQLSPSRIWKLLEHGEKLECLSCIPVVSELLYDNHPKTREISAWWLRRRIFGVFGPGETYSKVVATLADTTASEKQRAYAANALGEFLVPAGVRHVARAAVTDSSPLVREAAIVALDRLNHEGPGGEVGRALSDEHEGVRLAALKAAMSVHVFSDVQEVARRVEDESPRVRRRAAQVLGSLRARDAVVALIVLARQTTEPAPEVRQAAVWALGQLGDPAARPALEAALSDPDAQVQSTARIALRRL